MDAYRIVIDTEGSDKGAATIIKGACLALDKYPMLSLALAGNEQSIKEQLGDDGVKYLECSRLEIIHSSEVITNYDSPATALFEKPDSSLVRALSTLASRGDLLGVISAGNTGALIAGAMRFLSTPERTRPALAVPLPAENGGTTCLVDTGATVDCTAQMLLHFARLGTAFMSALHNIESPRVALLSNGSESTKGNAVVMLSAKGTVYSVSFKNGHSAIQAEDVMKLFIEKKKNSDAKIERLICMWHDGSIDLPSFAFREALVTAEGSNLSAKMLLSGLNGYVVKTVKASMTEGYEY